MKEAKGYECVGVVSEEGKVQFDREEREEDIDRGMTTVTSCCLRLRPIGLNYFIIKTLKFRHRAPNKLESLASIPLVASHTLPLSPRGIPKTTPYPQTTSIYSRAPMAFVCHANFYQLPTK